MSPLLEAADLAIANRHRRIGPFGVTVGRGEAVALVGPNGSGKTTFLRLALGLDPATSGTCRIGGVAVDPAHPPMGVGAVFEADGWYPWLSGRENLMLFAGVRRCDPTVVDELLETVGLTPAAERAVRHYSRGMRQRLAIARARLADPPLLVLDEPTVALDDEAGHWLVHLLVAHVAGGGGVLVASHDAAFLEALGGRVVPVDQGRCR